MKDEAEPEGSLPSHKNDGSAASQKGVIDLQSELGARAVPSEHCVNAARHAAECHRRYI